jgi:hypothetical protein
MPRAANIWQQGKSTEEIGRLATFGQRILDLASAFNEPPARKKRQKRRGKEGRAAHAVDPVAKKLVNAVKAGSGNGKHKRVAAPKKKVVALDVAPEE